MDRSNTKLFADSFEYHRDRGENVAVSGATIHGVKDEITRVRHRGFEPEAGVRPLTSGLVLRIKGKRNRFIRPEPVSNSIGFIRYGGTLITDRCNTTDGTTG